MKRPTFPILTVLGLMIVCAITTVAQESKVSKGRAEDEAAIRENVKQMETGWNTKSGASFAKPFADDADYVIINGFHIRGRDAIEKGHQQVFDADFKNTTVSFTVKQVRFLRPDVALVHVSSHRDAPESERELVSDAMMVMVMTKEGGKWRIASFQNTRALGPPPSK